LNLDERDLIITRGTWAQTLVAQDLFQDMINDLCEEKFMQFCMTSSENVEEREALYWLLRGVKEFSRQLATYIQDKDYLLKEEENNNDRREE